MERTQSIVEALLSTEDVPPEAGAGRPLAELLAERRATIHQRLPVLPRRRLTADAGTSELRRNFRLLAHAHMLRRRAATCWTGQHVLAASECLVKHALFPEDSPSAYLPAGHSAWPRLAPMSDAGGGSGLSISYEAFAAAAAELPLIAELVPPLAFAKLPRDPATGSVPLRLLLRYARSRVHLANVWRRLECYDSEGDGWLREHDVENYVFEALPELPALGGLQDNFYPFYVFTAVRKVFFALDPHRSGRVRVGDLLASPVLREWLALFPPDHPHLVGSPHQQHPLAHGGEGGGADSGASSPSAAPPGAAGGEAVLAGLTPAQRAQVQRTAAALLASLDAARLVSEEGEGGGGAGEGSGYAPAALPVDEPAGISATNWFAAATAIRVYTQYLDLDADQNGLLSPAELARAYGGTLTEAFLARLFATANTYGGEVDFKGYLDFVLALEYRQTPSSLRYLFRCLDMHGEGALTLPVLRHFFGDVAAKMAAAGHEPVDVANVCDECFDMVHPAAPGRITLEDVRRCGVGHTLLHLLTDAAGFWQYDNREFLLQQQQQAKAGAEGGGGAGGASGVAGGADGAADGVGSGPGATH